MAPHICEEIWQNLGHAEAIHHQAWPTWDEEALKKQEVEIAVQINGKVKARIMVPADLTKDDAAVLLERDEVRRLIDGKPVIKQVFVPGRLLNLVVKG